MSNPMPEMMNGEVKCPRGCRSATPSPGRPARIRARSRNSERQCGCRECGTEARNYGTGRNDRTDVVRAVRPRPVPDRAHGKRTSIRSDGRGSRPATQQPTAAASDMSALIPLISAVEVTPTSLSTMDNSTMIPVSMTSVPPITPISGTRCTALARDNDQVTREFLSPPRRRWRDQGAQETDSFDRADLLAPRDQSIAGRRQMSKSDSAWPIP